MISPDLRGGTEDGEPLYFKVGPFFNFATSEKFMLTAMEDYKIISFGNGINDNRKSMDAGILIKAGIKTPPVPGRTAR